jgi:myo-inositol catabolism protein IolS
VSTITFGCWELGNDGKWTFTSDDNNIAALRQAFDRGVTTFDSAEGYGSGHSELVVGKALSGIRNQCVIASKVSPGHLHAGDVRRSIEVSLKNLGTDYLDIYYIHWPNTEVPLAETLGEFDKLKAEGLIRAIGVSNFSLEQLEAAAKLTRIDILQLEYSLLKRDPEVGILPFCIAHGIGFTSYSSLAKGILTGAYHLGHAKVTPTDFRAERRLFLPAHLEKETELILLMKALAERQSVSISQVALAWLLCRPGMTTAIIGTQSAKHLDDNLAAAGVVLPVDMLDQLDAMSAKVLASL